MPGLFLLCMGLFSRFCVWALRSTARERAGGGVAALRDYRHSGASRIGLSPVSKAGGNGPAPTKQETDMTELNNEIRELTFDELEQVSGGSILDRIVDKYLADLGARLLDAVRMPQPKMSLHMR